MLAGCLVGDWVRHFLQVSAANDCTPWLHGKDLWGERQEGQRLLSRATYLGPRQKPTTAATPARARRRRQADQPGRADNAQRPCFSQRSTGLAPRRVASRSAGWWPHARRLPRSLKPLQHHTHTHGRGKTHTRARARGSLGWTVLRIWRRRESEPSQFHLAVWTVFGQKRRHWLTVVATDSSSQWHARGWWVTFVTNRCATLETGAVGSRLQATTKRLLLLPFLFFFLSCLHKKMNCLSVLFSASLSSFFYAPFSVSSPTNSKEKPTSAPLTTVKAYCYRWHGQKEMLDSC